ncbi:MAG: sigma-70 family RNA polymerase sigma factor [Fibrobacterota bacterium]|nr:sigma-70 family RNA polymerase sigma factor [Fibrobacterota bacterium]QQS07179.1 MAG: sigma-70 family RNA polymerase sigma factor [Fibrobacterota bacterium]
MNASDWIRWVALAREGDKDAFHRLYSATRPRLHNAVAHLVDPGLASEIVQRAFVRAWERLSDLAEDAAFGGWLRRIAVNLVRDHWRREKLTVEVPDDDDPQALADSQPDPEALWESHWEALQLRQAISELPPAFREAVVLHYLDDLPVEEVSRILDVPRGTVLSRLSRGRARLRLSLAAIREVTR